MAKLEIVYYSDNVFTRADEIPAPKHGVNLALYLVYYVYISTYFVDNPVNTSMGITEGLSEQLKVGVKDEWSV